MNVFAIMATCGRHRCAERSLACFLKQDYEGEHTLLIHNNSPVSQTLSLPPLPPNKHVILLNRSNPRHADRYASLGDIYNDSIEMVPSTADIIIFWDDDDIYMPNHISEGVQGYKRNLQKGFNAYKPQYSFFRYADENSKNKITVVANNMEPSVFVEAAHILKYKFSNTTSDQHMQWYGALEGSFTDPAGKPTLVYNWGDTTIPTFKTSGNPGNPTNFENYRAFSQEHGDQILTPLDDETMEWHYDQVRDSGKVA